MSCTGGIGHRELLRKPALIEPGRISINVSSGHHTDHWLINIQPVEGSTDYREINESRNEGEHRPASTHHCWQRPTPRRGDETQLPGRSRMLGSVGEQVPGRVTGRYGCRWFRKLLQDVCKKVPIGVRFPSYCWTRVVSEPRPINGNRRKGGCKLVSQGSHFKAG